MHEADRDAPSRDEWDEYDWERFLQRADVRTAKFQELFETLSRHPQRDLLIAREMGWEEEVKKCGASGNCPECKDRASCEIYELVRISSEPDNIEDEPDADELIACFEQLRKIPAYCLAQQFSSLLDKHLRPLLARHSAEESILKALANAQMVPAQIAGGHGIGYERDCLCGNIANCKRALRSLAECLEELDDLRVGGVLPTVEASGLLKEAETVSTEVHRWIDTLRARIWWR